MRLVPGSEQNSITEYVAWLPSKLVKIGNHVRIDSKPGLWLIIQAGDARPAYIVEAWAENARKGYASVSGHEELRKGK